MQKLSEIMSQKTVNQISIYIFNDQSEPYHNGGTKWSFNLQSIKFLLRMFFVAHAI